MEETLVRRGGPAGETRRARGRWRPAFAYRYERSHTAAEALAAYRDEMGEEGPAVAVAGRIARSGLRARPTFAHLEDAQAGSRSTSAGMRSASGGHLVELLDLDDHVGVTGHACSAPRRARSPSGPTTSTPARSRSGPCPRGKTQAGEEGAVTYGGLTDPEVRYRQRYADLAVHPEVRAVFLLRARAIA